MTLDMACILVFPFDIMLLQRFQALFSLQCFQAECVKNENPPINHLIQLWQQCIKTEDLCNPGGLLGKLKGQIEPSSGIVSEKQESF